MFKTDFYVQNFVRKRSLEREHPFMMKIILITNSCFIQHSAPLAKFWSKHLNRSTLFAQNVWFSALFWGAFSFMVFRFGNVTRHCSTFLYQSCKNTYFSRTLKYCPCCSEKLRNQASQCLEFVAFRPMAA